MGGKGIRRREKNYKAAHGGNSRLPPPPNPSSIEPLPSKLRKIMSIAGAVMHVKKKTGSDDDKGVLSGVAFDSTVTGANRKRNNQSLMSNLVHSDEDPKTTNLGKKKKKRNNYKAEDLRFETELEPGAVGSQRKERKKQRLEERKKKCTNGPLKDDEGFRQRKQIKFGDIVQAPPKLTAVPKVFKTTHNASQERIRLQAVEAYRKHKGWISRPGEQLPPNL